MRPDRKHGMAFTDLFTRQSLTGAGGGRPAEPARTYRSRSESDQGRRGGKREAPDQRRGPHEKKQRYQEQKMDTYSPASVENDDSKATRLLNAGRERAHSRFIREGKRNHSEEPGHTDMFHKGRHCTTKNNHNTNQQRQVRKKTQEWQKNLHPLKNKWKNAYRGGRHEAKQNSRNGGGDRKHKYDKQNVYTKLPRAMTQEFKDQNAFLLDGRFVCRHYLRGRCMKGDDCQLEHSQGRNDVIKEVCKFYIQGFCMKGESCLYMHKSFPCKFFHRKGKCSQGADCRFSHEPLNDVTNRLLDEALKWENELAKEAEQDSSGQPAKTDESKVTNTISDTLMHPLRPNFYNSEQTTAEQESLLCQAEEPSVDAEEPHPHQAQPNSPLSTEPIQEGPVCYSVEAVLGRQHFKPFPNFTTMSRGWEAAFFSASKRASGSVKQCEVPYSVTAFLRSRKSAENFTLGHTLTPPAAQAVSCASKTNCKEVTGALLRSDVENQNVLCPVSSRDETSKSQVHQTLLLSETCSDSTLVSGDSMKRGVEIPHSPKPGQSVSCSVGLEFLHSPVSLAEKSSKSERDMKESTRPPTDITLSVNTQSESVAPDERKPSYLQTSFEATLKHPLSPHPCSMTSQSQASVKPVCPAGLSKVNRRVAVSAEPGTSPDKIADCGNSVSQSARPTSRLDKVSSGFFLGLFTAPFLPAPPLSQSQLHDSGSASCSPESRGAINAVFHLKDSKQTASESQTPLQCQVRNDQGPTAHRPTSPKLSTSPRNEGSVNLHKEQQVDTAHVPPESVCEMPPRPAPCGNVADSSEAQSHQPQLGITSHKAATASSVLKSLFLCLSPYQQDGEQQDIVPTESEKDKSSTKCVFVKTQQNNKREVRSKQTTESKDDHQLCSRKPVTHSVKPRTCFQTTCGSTLCSPPVAEPQLRRSAKHNLPLRAVTQPLQHHALLKQRPTLEEGKCVNGNTVVTPLQDLFKTFDTSLFQCGH